MNYADGETAPAYESMLRKDGVYYWVATRYVDTFNGGCYFRVRGVDWDSFYGQYLFDSTRYNNAATRALFPVVSLSSDFIEPDGANYKVK